MTKLSRKVIRRRVLIATAALPLMQFFTGCFPNIPGVPNVPGAINLEIQNLIINGILGVAQIILANILNL